MSLKAFECKRLISADTGPGGPNTHRLVLILTQPRERKHRVYLLMWNSGQFDPTKARWAGRETLELDQEAGLKRTNPNSPFTSWSWAAGRIKAGRGGLNVSHIHPPGSTGWREEVSEGSGSFLSCSLWLVSLTDTNANVSAVNWRKSFVRANIVNESWRVTSVRRTCGLREAGDGPTSTLLWFRRLVSLMHTLAHPSIHSWRLLWVQTSFQTQSASSSVGTWRRSPARWDV